MRKHLDQQSEEWLAGYREGVTDAGLVLEQSDLSVVDDPLVRQLAALVIESASATLRAFLRHGVLDARVNEVSRAGAARRATEEALILASALSLRENLVALDTVGRAAASTIHLITLQLEGGKALSDAERAFLIAARSAWSAVLAIATRAERPRAEVSP